VGGKVKLLLPTSYISFLGRYHQHVINTLLAFIKH
jgi:hypothetical protein